MFIDDSAAITAAIRAGNIQQVQAEPSRRPSAQQPGSEQRVLVGARQSGSGGRR
ncbi:MAG: hypothetical protein QM711_07455 [Micropruina sp.]|uniref:hypothetical protein n=1 Tax=Micropruina sp. TaxID=2737536 RepID=UPI0039E30EA2